MTRRILTLALFPSIAAVPAIHWLWAENDSEPVPVLQGRLVTVGIPGLSAVAPVGTYLPGGPIPANFAAYTQQGRELDPKRILVGSTSNFGEPRADPKQLPGSFLSIDPTGPARLARSVLRNNAM